MEEIGSFKLGVVIVAGGSGRRMGSAMPKQFLLLDSEPILYRTIKIFAESFPTSQIVVVLPEEHIEYWRNLSSRFWPSFDHKIVAGGTERFYSVKAGIEALSEGVDLIAVHDGVRPLVSADMLDRCVKCALSSGSAVPVVALSDSVRQIGDDGVSHILSRSTLRAVQTPQIFDAITLRRAYAQGYDERFTDDSSLVEQMGERIWLCEGDRRNIKITTMEDIHLAEIILGEF
ncbi:MAG: 2-C-methyl-D-erythritol 4-phosphate cytidylyltransferase [Rikenellaceae bacterium]